MPETYDIGDRLTLKVLFKNDVGILADPTTVTCRVRKPNRQVVTFTGAQLQHPGPGDFRASIDIDQPGRWTYRFEGTGALVAADETIFDVTPSVFQSP